MPGQGTSRSQSGGTAGFTLIEVMVTVVIIGVLASIGIPNYIRAQEHAKAAKCVANQRHLSTAGTVYAGEHGILDDTVNVLDLFTEGLVPADVAECPSSGNPDHDDYDILIVGGVARDVTCLIQGDDHSWEPN
jgi:prepilin-type N-terminal cleavage/methylation domain-containing protein